jgi:hypothetical protein
VTLTSHQRPVRGVSDEWLTPPEIVNALAPFDLDPCAPVARPWPTAGTHYTIQDDGLRQDWFGFVWVNPPFGPDAGAWLDRLAGHGEGIGLAPARTETRWFVEQIWRRASAVLFLHGRPYFHRVDGTRGHANSGAPICLIGYGTKARDRLAGSGLAGSLVESWGLL